MAYTTGAEGVRPRENVLAYRQELLGPGLRPAHPPGDFFGGRLPLVREMLGDKPYEYYPLVECVIMAPGIYGGHPTFNGEGLYATVKRFC